MTLKGFFVSLGLVMFTVAVCETMFNAVYYSYIMQNGTFRNLIANDVVTSGTIGNILLLATCLLVPTYFLIWKMLNRKWFRISVIAFACFLFYWLAIGFPITINSAIGDTQYYPQFFANLREIVSWYVYLVPATIAYLLSGREYKEDVLF
jgi:uncharacterized membrane-anchored protein